jgi:CRISPR type I-E-associated protein CasB/Cse2
MATQSKSSQQEKDSRFVEYLLTLREDSSARSALRHGDQPALDYRALPYLAPWFREQKSLNAAMLFASVIASNTAIGYKPGVSLGQALYEAVAARALSQRVVSSRLLAVQRQSLPLAHRTLRGPFASLNRTESAVIDWLRVWRLYLWWDLRKLEVQRAVRRRVLLDFYNAFPEPGRDVSGTKAH